jgi:hypothetical protein
VAFHCQIDTCTTLRYNSSIHSKNQVTTYDCAHDREETARLRSRIIAPYPVLGGDTRNWAENRLELALIWGEYTPSIRRGQGMEFYSQIPITKDGTAVGILDDY